MPKDPGLRTKVVVRRLPPGLTEEAFLEALHGAVESSAYNWMRYVQGKQTMKKVVTSTAFINFRTPVDVFGFSSKFHGKVFTADNGAQIHCLVQYSPSQKVPRPRPRKDPRENTLKKDQEYLSFLERLKEPPKPLPSAEAQLQMEEKASASAASAAAQGEIVVTPLMAFLKEKYAKKAAKTRVVVPKTVPVKGRGEEERLKSSRKGKEKASSGKGAVGSASQGKNPSDNPSSSIKVTRLLC
mmetsp:Transcript_22869/g.63499  ORF Transcript_22869/g.63499 Transcript_22869/m.63499 type:complete len:241 (-) Transcript_22869:1248-1970(-)